MGEDHQGNLANLWAMGGVQDNDKHSGGHSFCYDFCPDCGWQLTGKFSTCPRCGADLGFTTCPYCGGEIHRKSKHCPHCTAPLELRKK